MTDWPVKVYDSLRFNLEVSDSIDYRIWGFTVSAFFLKQLSENRKTPDSDGPKFGYFKQRSISSIHKEQHYVYDIMLPTPILNDSPEQLEALFRKFKQQQSAKAAVVLAREALTKVNTKVEQGVYTPSIGKFAIFARQLELNRAIREFNDLHSN